MLRSQKSISLVNPQLESKSMAIYFHYISRPWSLHQSSRQLINISLHLYGCCPVPRKPDGPQVPPVTSSHYELPPICQFQRCSTALPLPETHHGSASSAPIATVRRSMQSQRAAAIPYPSQPLIRQSLLTSLHRRTCYMNCQM